MTDGFGLRYHWFVILAVFAAVAVDVEEEFREVNPALITGLAIEFGETHLGDLMAGHDGAFASAEITL